MITVLIPTARRPEFLRQALSSIQDQTAARNITEVIVSENGGGDESKSVVKEFPDLPIRYLFRNPPLGLPEHHKDLFCNGPHSELTAVLHDDDWWMPDHLANALGALQRHQSAATFYSSYFSATAESSILSCDWNAYFWFGNGFPDFKPVWVLGLADVILAALLYTPGHYSTLVARTGPFRAAMESVARLNNPFDNDRMLAVELAKHGPLLFRPYPDAFIRAHPAQDARTYSFERQISRMSGTTDWILAQCSAAGIDVRPALALRLANCPDTARESIRHCLSKAHLAPQLRKLAAGDPRLASLAVLLSEPRPSLGTRLRPFLPPVISILGGRLKAALLSPKPNP